jgi:hypothetical protein
MSAKTVLSLIVWVVALSALADFSFSASAPLPKSTEEMLKKLKLESAILANIDKELEVPKAWLDGARKEGKLRIYSTFDPGQVEVLSRPFKERYPYINIEYLRCQLHRPDEFYRRSSETEPM